MLNWVPNLKAVSVDEQNVTSRASSNIPGWVALAGLAIFYVGINGVWAFLERIGDRSGLDGTIGTALSLAFVLGAVGSLSAGSIVRLLVLVPAAWTFGGATGPATGGLLLEQYGIPALYAQYIICIIMAWAVFLGINRHLNSPSLYAEAHL